MEKGRIALAAVGCLLGAFPARAETPYVAGEYPLRVPSAPSFYVAAAASDAGDALAVFVWPTFEGEPYPGTVAILKGKGAPFELSGVWSAACDEDWKRVAVGEQLEVIDNTLEPPFARTSILCRELSMDAAALGAALYYDGFVGNGYVTRPVIYELDSGAREPLPVAGGDFVDWAGESRLVIGREVGGGKAPGVSGLELYGYNLENRHVTRLAGRDDAEAKLGEKLSSDVRASPYLPAAWRLAPTTPQEPGAPLRKIVVPARNGYFESGGRQFFWRPEGGEPAAVAKGVAVAASGDGTWVVTFRGDEAARPLTAYRLAWR